MNAVLRLILLVLLLPLSWLTALASGDTIQPSPDDEALRRAVVGSWLYEQDAGVASASMFTTYREDGIAVQLLKTKFIFKQATGVWIENRWSIQNGTLHLTPLRSRSHSTDAKVDMEEAVRQLLNVDNREMSYRLKGKERKERRAAGIPTDVQTMIDELSKKY